METKLLKVLIISFILFGCNPSFKQGSHEFYIVIDKQNILYSGIKNPITLCIPAKYKNDDLNVYIDNGDCQKVDSATHWVISPKQIGLCNLKIFSEKNLNLYDFTFRVIQPPPPVLGVRGPLGHTPRALKDLNHLFAFPPQDFPYDIRYHILSFDLLIYYSNSQIFQHSNSGEKFSKEITNMINQNQPIDSLKFMKILFTYPDGATGNVKSYTVQNNT